MLIRYGYEITVNCQQPTAMVTLLGLREGIDPADGGRLGELSRGFDIEFRPGPAGAPRVFAAGAEVTEAIRSQEVSRNVSEVSAHRAVRAAMVAKAVETTAFDAGAAADHKTVFKGLDVCSHPREVFH